MLRRLVGSGDKIALLVLPFLAGGLILNLAFPTTFDVGGPPLALKATSIVVLIPGVAIWAWSATPILRKSHVQSRRRVLPTAARGRRRSSSC